MEWSFDAADPPVVSAVRRELADFLERHAEPVAHRRVVELVFDELVGNVCRYAPGPAWVHVDWTAREPVLHVRDLGPGFSLTEALTDRARGGLRIVSDVAGPVHVARHRRHGADVSVRLPIRRADQRVAVTLGTAGGLLPSPEQVDADGSVGRDAFLGALAVQLAQAVEQTHGPAAGQSAVSAVGAAVGARIEQEYRRARALTDRLPPAQLAELFVSLEAAIGGDFYVVSVNDEQIVLGNRRCPLGEAVRKAPSLCQMTSSAFGGIAERNAGPASVRLEQRIAVGDPECRVVISLHSRTRLSPAARIPAPRGQRLRAVLAEDAVFMREPLLRVLAEAGIDVVAQCDNPRDVLARVRTYEPDVAIIDFQEDQTAEALAVAGTIRREHQGTGVLVLAERVDADSARTLLEAATSGIGYLLKDRVADVEDFVGHVRTVAASGTALDAEVVSEVAALHRADDPLSDLTPREADVMQLLARGLSNDAIAAQLVVTKRAVEKHIGNIFLKLGLPPSNEHERRVMAALAYRQSGGRR